MLVGAAQDLLKNGASMPVIMNKGGWSKTDAMMKSLGHVDHKIYSPSPLYDREESRCESFGV